MRRMKSGEERLVPPWAAAQIKYIEVPCGMFELLARCLDWGDTNQDLIRQGFVNSVVFSKN
jgi:hypothetical protein